MCNWRFYQSYKSKYIYNYSEMCALHDVDRYIHLQIVKVVVFFQKGRVKHLPELIEVCLC